MGDRASVQFKTGEDVVDDSDNGCLVVEFDRVQR
jgi:hypothetical protein